MVNLGKNKVQGICNLLPDLVKSHTGGSWYILLPSAVKSRLAFDSATGFEKRKRMQDASGSLCKSPEQPVAENKLCVLQASLFLTRKRI